MWYCSWHLPEWAECSSLAIVSSLPIKRQSLHSKLLHLLNTGRRQNSSHQARLEVRKGYAGILDIPGTLCRSSISLMLGGKNQCPRGLGGEPAFPPSSYYKHNFTRAVGNDTFLRSCSDSWALATARERSESPFRSSDTRCDLDYVDDWGIQYSRGGNIKIVSTIPDITLCFVNQRVNICNSKSFLRNSTLSMNHYERKIVDKGRELFTAPAAPEIDSNTLTVLLCRAQSLA
jgi:hypothetical protein